LWLKDGTPDLRMSDSEERLSIFIIFRQFLPAIPAFGQLGYSLPEQSILCFALRVKKAAVVHPVCHSQGPGLYSYQ
jgi:hypothetical protein